MITSNRKLLLSITARPLPAATSNASVLLGNNFFNDCDGSETPGKSHTRCHIRCARGKSPPSRRPSVARHVCPPLCAVMPLNVASSLLARQQLATLSAAAHPAAASWPAAGLLSTRSRG